MTQMKERAVELIERIPDEKMFYVINILQNLEEMSSNRPADKKQAMEALQNVLKFSGRLPEDFDADKELQEARNYRRQGRKSMVILVDTNIIIDALANREPYADDAKRIMEKCAAREITGILAAHSIPNLFYILRKNFSQEERRFLLKNLCEIFQISDLNEKKIVAALENNAFSDFEDGLQEECAVESMADYIVTRNPADFKHSRVKVILPDELLRELEKN